MVVVDRKYVDQPGNMSRKYVEYVVRDIHTSEMFPGARRLSPMGGVSNGDDDVLHPATTRVPNATIPGVPGTLPIQQVPALNSDGDQVLVAFIEGSKLRPVIVGVFQHSANTYGANSVQGERRLTQHAGSSREYKVDGTYIVTQKSGATLTLDPNGNITSVPAGDGKVFLGSATATDAAVRGTTYRSAEDSYFAAANALAEGLGAAIVALQAAVPTLTGSPTQQEAFAAAVTALSAPGGLLASFVAAVSAFNAGVTSYLSTKVEVSP